MSTGICEPAKLIVIDGLDGSGKTTQAAAVFEYLKTTYKKVLLISYPDYESDSSALVKMYLNGAIAPNPNEVNAYAASSFYAVDRYASFKRDWEAFYKAGGIILATRYVTSNAIHQMSKLDKSEWEGYLEWLSDYEYVKLGLPRPDAVLFLDMPREIANKLICSRYKGDESQKDIHERNMEYMRSCEESAHYASESMKWLIINCADGGNPRSAKSITKEIIDIIEQRILSR